MNETFICVLQTSTQWGTQIEIRLTLTADGGTLTRTSIPHSMRRLVTKTQERTLDLSEARAIRRELEDQGIWTTQFGNPDSQGPGQSSYQLTVEQGARQRSLRFYSDRGGSGSRLTSYLMELIPADEKI